MKFREANQKDVKLLEDINLVAKKEQGWWIPQNRNFYRKFLKNKNNRLYMAIENNVLLGFLSLEYNQERKSTWINDIYVLPEARKNGIAKKLVEIAIKDWKKRSKSIVLLTADRNLTIFKKLGFKKTMNFMEIIKK